MLNRKYADLRHAPRLDPEVEAYDPRRTPQSLVRMGKACRRKEKGGLVLAEPGWLWALSLFTGSWYAITSVFDARGSLVAHHVDLCRPVEERDSVLSFLDLKLDLVLPAKGAPVWVDEDEYAAEVRAGTIEPAWQETVDRTVREIDRAVKAGKFPPENVRSFRPR